MEWHGTLKEISEDKQIQSNGPNVMCGLSRIYNSFASNAKKPSIMNVNCLSCNIENNNKSDIQV